jgi:3-oxoacyl-[acyl-carrier-protein] synthase-3
MPPEAGTSGAGTFGITSFGHALGEQYDVAEQAPHYTADLKKIRAWGYRGFHRADDATGLTDLAVRAGQAALEASGVAPADVDLVVLAIADIAEHLYWDPAAATQARLGAHNAEALLLNQACGAGVMAFDAAAGKLASHPDYTRVLIIAANRVCEAYWNRMEANTCVSSDGAAAALAVRGHRPLRWLATEVISDGRYADFFRLPAGGAGRPFTAGLGDAGRVQNPFERLEEFFGRDARAMYEFVRTIVGRNREVLDRACKRVGADRDRVRHVVHLNDNIKALRDLAREWDVPLERTNAELALDHGHLGTADQVFGLERLVADGRVAPGDLVALTSMGSGMHWACTLIEV